MKRKKMFKTLLCFLILSCVGGSLFLLFRNQKEPVIAKSLDDYLACLQNATNEEIAFYDYNDYDGDGICEMFAIVGKKEPEWNNISGELWFVNHMGADKIDDEKRYWCNPGTYRIQGRGFFVLEEFYETGSVTFLWSVKDDAPYQPNLSGKGNGMNVNQYGEIELADSQYDAGETAGMLSGHTWKHYYFYYDGENFREYGGREMTRTELLKIKGAKEIVGGIEKKGNSIDTIFYRENGICNINYSKGKKGQKDYENVSFRMNDDLEVISDRSGELYEGGTYKAALIPEIATYPEPLNYSK